MENIELVSSSDFGQKELADLTPAELARFKIKGDIKLHIKFNNPIALEGAANVNANEPTGEHAKFKIRIKGDIKLNIKFSNPITTETAIAELARKDDAVCIYVGNEGEGTHFGGTVSAVDMNAVEIADIQMVSAAKVEDQTGSNAGGKIRIGVRE